MIDAESAASWMLTAHVDRHTICKNRHLRFNYFHLLRGFGCPRFGYKNRSYWIHVLIISSGLCTLFLFTFHGLLILFKLLHEAIIRHDKSFALDELKCLVAGPSILPNQVRHHNCRRSTDACSAMHQDRSVLTTLLDELIGLFKQFQ